jgi:hypothetical protein
MRDTLTVMALLVCLFIPAGCLHGDTPAPKSSAATSLPQKSLYDLDYIRELSLACSTSYSHMQYDEHRRDAPFPENTKGIILRIKGDEMPDKTTLRVRWFHLEKGLPSPLITQRVSPEELNRLQYVDLTLYQRDGELPSGDYEVKLEDEASAKSLRLTFSIL